MGGTFTFVHAADLHLDSALRGLDRYEGAPSEAIRSATRKAFCNLVDLCIEEKAALLLLVGDLYDGQWKDHHTALFFLSELARLKETRVFFVRGNHDAASVLTKSLRMPAHVHEFGSRAPSTVIVDGFDVPIAIHGQSFATKAVTEDLSRSYPPPVTGAFNIGLLHTCAEGREGHENYAPCRTDHLVRHGYDYWALGHVHDREVLHREPWIIFPGNLQGRHIRETGPKGVTVVRVNNGRVSGEPEHHALDVFRWAATEIDVSETRTLEEVVTKTADALAGAVDSSDGRPLGVRLRFVGATQLHETLEQEREQLTAEIHNLANQLDSVWVEKIQLRTESVRRETFAVGAWKYVEAALNEVQQEAAGAQPLRTMLQEFRAKLPAEAREGEDALMLQGESFTRLVEGAAALLSPPAHVLENESPEPEARDAHT